IVEIEGTVRFANICLTDDDAFFLERPPGGDVGVVVQSGDDDFVPGLQLAADGAGEREGDGGHVLAEDDFVRLTVEQIGHGRARGGNYGVIGTASGEGAAGGGVGGEKIMLHRVRDLLGTLPAGGPVGDAGGVAHYPPT